MSAPEPGAPRADTAAATPSGPASARGQRTARLQRLVPAATLGLLAAFLLRDVLFGGRVFYYRDIHLQWVVQAEALVRVLGSGSWPVWNPWLSFGQPMIANPNNEMFYPITWLHLALLPWDYYTLFVTVHFLLTGAGAYRLSRALGLSRTAATVGAGAWMASGPFVSLVNLWNHLAGAAWIPWSGWAAHRAFASGRMTAALAWGATLAAPILAGSPEAALMAGVLGAVVSVAAGRRAGAPRAPALVLAACVFALGVAAAQWMPSLELARRSMRALLTPFQKTLWSLPPPGLALTLAPAILDQLPLRPEVRRLLFEGREPFLASLYLGLGASGLVVAALMTHRRLPRALLALFVLCALVALGRHGIVYALLVDLVPGMQTLRFPAKAMILAAFVWSLLAGFGLDALRADNRPAQRAARVCWMTISLAAIGVGGLLLFGADAYGPLLVAPESTRRSLTDVLAPVGGGLVAAGAAALLTAWLSTATARRALGLAWAPVLATVVIVDLALAHRDVNPTADKELFRYRPAALRHLRDAPPGSRVYSYDYNVAEGLMARHYLGHEPYVLRFRRDARPVPEADAAALRSALYPSVLGYWGVETAYAIDALGLYSPDLAALTWFVRRKEQTPVERKLLQMGAVGRVAALHHKGFEDLPLVAEEPTLLEETLKIFAVPDPLPRAYAVDGVRVADREDALRTIEDPGFDPRRELILPSGETVAPHSDFSARVSILSKRGDHVSIEASLSHPGYVVLVDTYDPGWRATVDGHPAPVLRANVAFRGVPVPAGAHRLELRYRPPAVTLGLATTLASLAVAVLVARRRPRPREPRHG